MALNTNIFSYSRRNISYALSAAVLPDSLVILSI